MPTREPGRNSYNTMERDTRSSGINPVGQAPRDRASDESATDSSV
jgi:hypothetical protein